jgi:hypothetical protein
MLSQTLLMLRVQMHSEQTYLLQRMDCYKEW